MKSDMPPMLFPKRMVAGTASGASGDVWGVLVPEPTCMQMAVPVSWQTRKNRPK